eukprot:3616205-Rhodomonas_salina.1
MPFLNPFDPLQLRVDHERPTRAVGHDGPVLVVGAYPALRGTWIETVSVGNPSVFQPGSTLSEHPRVRATRHAIHAAASDEHSKLGLLRETQGRG